MHLLKLHELLTGRYIYACLSMQALQERHENSILKTEIDKLRDENKAMRESIKTSSCPSCGFSASNDDSMSGAPDHDHKLSIENSRLKAEVQTPWISLLISRTYYVSVYKEDGFSSFLHMQVEKLRSIIEGYPPGLSPKASPYSPGMDLEIESRSTLNLYTGGSGLEKSRVTEIVNKAMDELQKMATDNEPLWIKSYETGREILNYDDYLKEFTAGQNSNIGLPKKSIEASRESGILFVDLTWLIQCFMDAVRFSILLSFDFNII